MSKTESSNFAIGCASILTLVFIYFFAKIISIILLIACLGWLAYEKAFNKKEDKDISTPRTLSIASALLCATVFSISSFSSTSDCDCAEVFEKALWSDDYSIGTYQECLEIYREEVIEGYDELDCPPHMVKLYLNSNWELYFDDKCNGDL